MTLSAAPPFSRVIDCLVDDRVGILNSVTEMRTPAGTPDFFHYSAQICNVRAFSRQTTCEHVAASSVNRERAAAGAITDAVAVYCAASRSEEHERVPVCSARTAPFQCTRPGDFALFSKAQYEEPGFLWLPFDEDTPVHWTQALDPLRDETIFVPAAMAFLPYSPSPERGEAPIAPATSTGLACHSTATQAALEALCDVIECDALALLWQAQLAPPHVRVETLSDANYDLVARFERTGSSITLLQLELDFGISTFLAVLSNTSPPAPARVFAAGTGVDPERAVQKSLERLAHVGYYTSLIHTQWQRIHDADSVFSQSDHLNFWCDHRNAPIADLLLSSHERLEFDGLKQAAAGDARQQLESLLHCIESAGYRALLADLTTPDVAAVGLSVLRAVVPGLMPLFFGFQTRALGGSRLWDLPPKLGHRGVQPGSGDNPWPHPFSRKGVAS